MLWTLLAINGAMFVAEVVVGWIAESTGLLADSLDMLADAVIYGVSLSAVGRAAHRKAKAAKLSGVLQIVLGLGVLAEVTRRARFGSEPISSLMMLMGCVALIANVACLLLLAKHRHDGEHMRASWIFSTNDVIANTGVIAAGLLVLLTDSAAPDLVIGTLISAVIVFGGIKILRPE
ncbi:MAG: cation transporter [Phycisphaeraceae bacterium]